MKQRNALKRGFTLIEIMIVVLIGGILMAMGLAGYQFLKQAKVKQNDTKLATVDTYLELYHQRLGEYPQELNELIEGPQKPALQRKWAEAMAKPDELVDPYGHPFEYERTPKGYELYSRGSTGEARIYSKASQEQ